MPAHFTLADSRVAGLPEILQSEQNLDVPEFPEDASGPLGPRAEPETEPRPQGAVLLQRAGHQIRLIAGRATPRCRQLAHSGKPAVVTQRIHLGVHIEN
jgi:hypothetical protein